MVIESAHHGASKAMAEHAHDTCFLLTSYSTEVAGAWLDAMPQRQDWPNGLESLTAVLCVAYIEAKKEAFIVCDAFIAGAPRSPEGKQFGELIAHLEAHRVVRWQDQLDAFLDSGKVTSVEAKKALHRHDVDAHLALRKAAQV